MGIFLEVLQKGVYGGVETSGGGEPTRGEQVVQSHADH